MTIRTQDYSSIITTPPAYTDPDYIEYGPPPAYTPSAPPEEAVESKHTMIAQKMGDLDQIPTFTNSSINILQNQMHVHIPPLLHTSEELTGRIQSIAKIKNDIQEVTDNKLRDKLIACLVIAGILTFTALTVLGSVFSIAPLFIAGLTLLLLNASITPHILYFTLTRLSRLEDLEKTKQELLQHEISRYKNENIGKFHQGHPFYKEQTPELVKKLDAKIEQSKKNLAIAEQFPELEKNRLSELRVELAEYQNARDQLITVSNFYQQFDEFQIPPKQ